MYYFFKNIDSKITKSIGRISVNLNFKIGTKREMRPTTYLSTDERTRSHGGSMWENECAARPRGFHLSTPLSLSSRETEKSVRVLNVVRRELSWS